MFACIAFITRSKIVQENKINRKYVRAREEEERCHAIEYCRSVGRVSR